MVISIDFEKAFDLKIYFDLEISILNKNKSYFYLEHIKYFTPKASITLNGEQDKNVHSYHCLTKA